MTRKCFVCGYTYVKGSDVTFHELPKNPQKRKTWLENLNWSEQLPKKKTCHVCSLHFSPNRFRKVNSRTTLKRGSLPKVKWSSVESLKTETEDVPENVNLVSYEEESDEDFSEPTKKQKRQISPGPNVNQISSSTNQNEYASVDTSSLSAPSTCDSDSGNSEAFKGKDFIATLRPKKTLKIPRYFGDFNNTHLTRPVLRNKFFVLANSTVAKLRATNRTLQQRVRRLTTSITSLKSLIADLNQQFKEDEDFEDVLNIMYHNCAVPGCNNRKSSKHRFPNPDRDRDRFDQWVHLVCNPKLFDMDPKRVYNNYRVCHEHFAIDDLSSNMYLTRSAVPSLNLVSRTRSESASSASKIVDVPLISDVPTFENETLSPCVAHFLRSSEDNRNSCSIMPSPMEESPTPISPKSLRCSLLSSVIASKSAELTTKEKTLSEKALDYKNTISVCVGSNNLAVSEKSDKSTFCLVSEENFKEYQLKCCPTVSTKQIVCVNCGSAYHVSCAVRSKLKCIKICDARIICCEKESQSFKNNPEMEVDKECLVLKKENERLKNLLKEKDDKYNLLIESNQFLTENLQLLEEKLNCLQQKPESDNIEVKNEQDW